MALPEEIWGLIFNNLSQNTVLNLRLVCRVWKAEVDNHYKNWVINLDERAPPEVMDHILRLRIKTCKIVRFLDPRPTDQGIFKHPHMIRSFSTVRNYNSELEIDSYEKVISTQNLHYVLKSCSRNLKYLKLDLLSNILTKPFPFEDLIFYKFPILEVLIIFCDFKNSSALKLNETNLLCQMINIPMPKLNSFTFYLKEFDTKLRFSKRDEGQMAFDLLAFVANHGNVLENLNIGMGYNDDDQCETFSTLDLDFGAINLRSLRQIKCLKTLDLMLVNKDQNSVTFAWREFVVQQTKLQKLGTSTLIISSKRFRKIIQGNFETLICIDINDLRVPGCHTRENIEPVYFIDLSLAECCKGLKKLHIRSENYEMDLPDPELDNVWLLPESLTDCSFSNFKFLPVNMIGFIRSHKNLSSLCLENCGIEEILDGVNGAVLEEILSDSHPNLTEVRIADFNTIEYGELKKVQSILCKAPFNCPVLKEYDNVDITFKRDEILKTWAVKSFEIMEDDDEDNWG